MPMSNEPLGEMINLGPMLGFNYSTTNSMFRCFGINTAVLDPTDKTCERHPPIPSKDTLGLPNPTPKSHLDAAQNGHDDTDEYHEISA